MVCWSVVISNVLLVQLRCVNQVSSCVWTHANTRPTYLDSVAIEVIAEGPAEFPVLNIRSLGIEGVTRILVGYLLLIRSSMCMLVVRARVCACSVASAVSNSLRPRGCSLPGSSAHGVLQARILQWVSMLSSRGSSQPREQSHISCFGTRILSHWRPPYVSPDLLIHPWPFTFFKSYVEFSESLNISLFVSPFPFCLDGMSCVFLGVADFS